MSDNFMIRGNSLHLRMIKEKDLTEFFSLQEKARMQGEYLGGNFISETHFRKAFQEHGFWKDDEGMLLIVNPDERLLGSLSYQKMPACEALQLHFFLFRAEDRGKGIMSEALALFATFLFRTKNINRLQIGIPSYDRACIRVAQKCRFTFEGITRKAVFHKGTYLDLCIYSMLREENKSKETQK